MSAAGFDDSIDNNIAILEAILSGQPRTAGQRAHHCAGLVEKAILGIIDSQGPKDPAVSLGVTCAVFKVAKMMVQGDGKAAEHNKGMIQLLS